MKKTCTAVFGLILTAAILHVTNENARAAKAPLRNNSDTAAFSAADSSLFAKPDTLNFSAPDSVVSAKDTASFYQPDTVSAQHRDTAVLSR